MGGLVHGHGETRQGEASVTADADPVRRVRQQGDGAALHRRILGQPRAGRVPVRRLRARAVRLANKVRLGDWLAELLGPGAEGARSRKGRPQLVHAESRSRVWQLWFPLRARIRGWSRADRVAVLHQLRFPEVSTFMISPEPSPWRL